MPEYPLEILPHESYRAKMDVDSLVYHESDACVVRRVADKPQLDNVFGVTVFVNYGILQAKDVLDMSTFLLGAQYQNIHLPFVDASKRDWKGEKMEEIRGVLADANNWSYIDKPSFPLIIRLSQLHLKTFDYPRTFESPKQKTDYEEKYKINSFYAIDDKKAIYSFSIRFVHTPTLLNYWHFEMKLYPSMDVVFPRKEEKKKWMRMMVEDFLQKQFVLALVEDEEDVADIDAAYYLKE